MWERRDAKNNHWDYGIARNFGSGLRDWRTLSCHDELPASKCWKTTLAEDGLPMVKFMYYVKAHAFQSENPSFKTLVLVFVLCFKNLCAYFDKQGWLVSFPKNEKWFSSWDIPLYRQAKVQISFKGQKQQQQWKNKNFFRVILLNPWNRWYRPPTHYHCNRLCSYGYLELIVSIWGLYYTLFLFYRNVVFPAQVEYSYFSADFRLKIFL